MIDISKISGNQIDRASILHSSGIGKAVHGHAFGASSSETFATRQTTEANRRHIGNYGSANVHSDHRTSVRPFSSGARADITPTRGGGRPTGAAPQRTFHDASRQRFDPYSG